MSALCGNFQYNVYALTPEHKLFVQTFYSMIQTVPWFCVHWVRDSDIHLNWKVGVFLQYWEKEVKSMQGGTCWWSGGCNWEKIKICVSYRLGVWSESEYIRTFIPKMILACLSGHKTVSRYFTAQLCQQTGASGSCTASRTIILGIEECLPITHCPTCRKFRKGNWCTQSLFSHVIFASL